MSESSATIENDVFSDLNPAQRQAVEHGAGQSMPPPLLVIAGAGSGKTRTLACRVARLMRDGADPQRIMLMTFSRRAAREMNQRVGAVLQQLWRLGTTEPPTLPWSGTFHSIAARLLRDLAPRIGLSDTFLIYDRADAEDLLNMVRQEQGLAQTEKRFPLKGTCLGIYSRVVNSQESVADVVAHHYPWCAGWEEALTRLFAGYVQAKQSQHVLDYDDLLLYWREAMRDPVLAAQIGARFDHVMIDEYQDTNRLQADILRAFKPHGLGVTVVGDDAQAIYGFRAATVRNILDFPAQFDTPADVVTLERNYRSTQPLLDASNAVIALSEQRYEKRLWSDRPATGKAALVSVTDDAGQARWVADQVLAARERGITLRSQAVLFRTSSHSAALELELMRRNVPFIKFGGLKFLEAAHIKDVLALMRWAHNPLARLAGLRVLQRLPGVGPVTASRLLDQMRDAHDPWSVMTDQVPTAAAREAWQPFLACVQDLRHARWPAPLDQALAWYLPRMDAFFDDVAPRRADLEQLGRLAGGYASLDQFLTDMALDPPEATSAQSGEPWLDEDYLVLSTIHSSKGQEWQAVYVLNVVDGCIPSDLATGSVDDIEEERRLLYVAMTRAKTQLQLVVPQRFYISQQGPGGGRHVYASRSRFLPYALEPLFEHLPQRPPLVVKEQERSASLPVMDVASRVRSMFSS